MDSGDNDDRVSILFFQMELRGFGKFDRKGEMESRRVDWGNSVAWKRERISIIFRCLRVCNVCHRFSLIPEFSTFLSPVLTNEVWNENMELPTIWRKSRRIWKRIDRQIHWTHR